MKPRNYRSIPMLACAGLLAFFGVAHALDDLPLFYDFYCKAQDDDATKWYNAGMPNNWTVGGEIAMKFDCENKYEGTSALNLTVANPVSSSYDLIMKFANDVSYKMTGYKDVRFMVKSATAEKVRVALEAEVGGVSKPFSALNVAIPASSEWTEVVVPFTAFDLIESNVTTSSGKFSADYVLVGMGFRFTYPDSKTGSDMNLLIDQVRFTDGTDHAPLEMATLPGGSAPTGWPSYLMVGTLDARANSGITSSTVAKAGDYRYEYIMPETFVDWGDAKYAQTYAEKSAELGVKSGFVWYNLGKVSEAMVPQNLANATYMTDYVNRYEEFLTQLAAAGQSDYIIVLEPDMYGNLLQKGHVPNLSCTDVVVSMARAEAVTSKTYDDNLCGWADYVIGRARLKLPKGVIIGHMLNHWGVNIPGQVGRGRVEAHLISANFQGSFLNSFGSVGKGDVVFVEKSDRDAGTEKEADWFWNEGSYARYFGWVRTLSATSGLRVVGWQVSEGNMAHTNTANRDNAAQHFVDHPDLWAKAGFIGVLFGAGEQGQANYSSNPKGEDNDGGWFKTTMTAYMATPYALSGVSAPVLRSSRFSYEARPLRACGNALCATAAVEIRNIAGISMGNLQAGERLEMQSGLYFWRAGATAGSVRVP